MLLVWALSVYGTNAIVTESKIFAPLRSWANQRWPWLGALLGCALCFGFWRGMGYSLLGLSPVAMVAPGWWPLGLRLAADGAAAAGLCWMLAVGVGTVTEVRFALETWRFREETRIEAGRREE